MQEDLWTLLIDFFHAKNVVEHYGKVIEILQGCPFEGSPNRVFWAEIG